MLRETIHWISRPTLPISIAVGLPPRATVPDVEGWLREKALAAISAAGLAARVTGANERNAYVISQEPTPMALVDPGSQVHINLQKGSPP
jgi:beta-lactam-binding protein with PASTA domain